MESYENTEAIRAIEEKKEDLEKAFASDESSTAGNKFLLKERFEINFNMPIDWLDANSAKAYRVHDRIDNKKELYALICNNETAPRSSCLPKLKSLNHHSILSLVEYGIVKNPLKNSRNVALIYEIPQGGRVIDKKETDIDFRYNYERFKTAILRLLSAIETLKGLSITHRAIRLDNLYYKDPERTEIILGDCVASFPGFHQGPLYETIENMMSQKEGRGNGYDDDDFYSVGMVGACLYLGQEPLQNLSAPELLRIKLKKSSYHTVLGDVSVPNQFSNILRGLLNDIKSARWKYIQAYNYLEGKGAINQPIRHERPKKSITINGEKVHEPIDVAFAMHNYVSEAFELIKSGKFLDWIKNGIDDEATTKKIEKAIQQVLKQTEKPDIVVAKICILIAPSLPIRINGLSLFPTGAPKAIFYALKTQKNLNPFYELFSSDLIKTWYMEQENLRSPVNANEFQNYINSKEMGYGIDRIMYDFDDDLPCVSPLLGDDFVNSATKILRALDTTYSIQKTDVDPYDKTIIAYLRCKLGKKVDAIVANLNSSKEEMRISSILKLYTTLQKKYGPPKVPFLGMWMINFCKPLIKIYHNIKYQKYLERELIKINKNGKLYEIFDVLENSDARIRDAKDYNKVVAEVNNLLTEKNKILSSSNKLDDEAKHISMKAASALAVLTMVASFVLNIIHMVLK